jgi:hypothetical protein
MLILILKVKFIMNLFFLKGKNFCENKVLGVSNFMY